ncbi:hypothetical protein Tco_0795719 [Tanacetum coccineum]
MSTKIWRSPFIHSAAFLSGGRTVEILRPRTEVKSGPVGSGLISFLFPLQRATIVLRSSEIRITRRQVQSRPLPVSSVAVFRAVGWGCPRDGPVAGVDPDHMALLVLSRGYAWWDLSRALVALLSSPAQSAGFIGMKHQLHVVICAMDGFLNDYNEMLG